ncbi:HPr kinase/phosphatase C-terminal domain-containing protein [Tardiphaga sp.]|uniref:HPr kinase/phosphorylase n=1 Tax=Tardiphaga sp. TaxID=1926292 RepID=UPI0019A9BEF6|nr:HPr kinase/phosphatase C-terminal domain-containing protein [Tardiphaga sp.]MBC7578434.1 HPr kinase/phosphatase C-terminal domain-containing protein [Tardiphaga sp.]
MNRPDGSSVHGSAVLVGDRAILIRGPSGSGKSRLVFDLILAGHAGQIPEAALVGDDRLILRVEDGRLLVRSAPELEGLLEIRGLGIRRLDFAAEAIVGWVVDLDAGDAARLPEPKSLEITIEGVVLSRIPVGIGFFPLPMVVAALTTIEGSVGLRRLDSCSKGIGNHISPTIATE